MRVYRFTCGGRDLPLIDADSEHLNHFAFVGVCAGCCDADGNDAFMEQAKIILEGRALGLLPRPAGG